MSKKLIINNGTKALEIEDNKIFTVISGDAELDIIIGNNSILEFLANLKVNSIILNENSKIIYSML